MEDEMKLEPYVFCTNTCRDAMTTGAKTSSPAEPEAMVDA
jgi:hypothetical protein